MKFRRFAPVACAALVACTGANQDELPSPSRGAGHVGAIAGAAGHASGAGAGGASSAGGAPSGGRDGVAGAGEQRDAGSMDASGSFPDASASPDAATSVWFSDDFEVATLDAKKWSVTKDGSNTVAVSSEQAAHGTRSLKLHYDAGNRFALVRVLKLVAPVDQHVFGRAYFRISALAGGHVAYIWTGNDGDGYPFQDSHYEIGAQDDWHIGWWQGGREAYGGGGGSIAYGKWFCVQWEARGKPGLARLWVDGKPLRDFVDGQDRVGTFNQIGIGIRQYQTNNGRTIDMFVDDVAVDGSPVPCL
jgi:hypothetical protein